MPVPVAAIPLLTRGISGLAGGIAGAQQGGWKGALIGAGAGAAAPSLVRMAGTRLAGMAPSGALAKLSGQVGELGLQTALGAKNLPAGYGLQAAGKAIGGNIGNLGTNLATAGGAGAVLGSAYGLLGAPGAGAVGGLGNRLLGGAQNKASGIIGYNAVTGEPIVGPAVPQGMTPYGGVAPIGASPYDVVDPGGAAAARRLSSVKNAEALRDAMNVVLPTERKFAEQAKKDDFERSMASAGIKQNIATNAALLQMANEAGLNMGLDASANAARALTQQYQY